MLHGLHLCCCCDRASRRHRDEFIYASGSREVSPSVRAVIAAGTRSTELELQILVQIRSKELKRARCFKLSKPISSGIYYPSKSHLLNPLERPPLTGDQVHKY